MDEFINYLKYLLDKKGEDAVYNELKSNNYNGISFRDLFFFVVKLPYGKDFLSVNLQDIIIKETNLEDFIYMYVKLFINEETELKRLAYHPNIWVRTYFMKTLVDGHKRRLRNFYPNITDYLVNKDENGNILAIMDELSLSEICAGLLDVVYDEEMFKSIRNFIIEHYPKNHLLKLIYNVDPSKNEDDLFNVQKEIAADIERLYSTSCDFKLRYLEACRERIPEYLRLRVKKAIEPFYPSAGEILDDIFQNELGDEFIHLVNKYLGISSSQVIKIHKTGTQNTSFIVGDFLIKYIRGYYNIYGADYECPKGFLFSKVYDRVTKKNSNGRFLGALEVQAKWDMPLREDQTDIIELFTQELANMGYYCDDLLVGEGRENVFRLHDYNDADCEDPKKLPKWFRKYPYVLVDLDCVYPIEYKEKVEEQKQRILEFSENVFLTF